MPSSARTATLVLALGAAALALTGCSSAKADGAPVTVKADDTTCVVSPTTLSAGPVSATLTNNGTKVNELYIFDDQGNVVGEKEDIAPGLKGTLNADLKAGSYEFACKPGATGDGIRVTVMVS